MHKTGSVALIKKTGGNNMRICKQCGATMIKDFEVKVEGGGYGIKIAKDDGLFAKRLAKPKAAICPICGEVSLYIENIEEILEKKVISSEEVI